VTIFQRFFGVSDHAEGSDNSKVGFGGIDGTLGKAWHSEGEGGARAKAKVKRAKKGMREGVCVEKVVVVTVVL